MLPSFRACCFVLAAAASQLYSPSAAAESPSSEASVEGRREQAKQHFQAGSAHYSAGRYQRAVREFVEADRLAPSPALSFNIARAYERLSDVSGALRWYRDYLRRSPNAKNASEVRARVSELTSQLARTGQQQLTVLSMPPGAQVSIDGRAVGVTPFTGDLALGQHRVMLHLPGYREAQSEVSLTPRSAEELNFSMASLPLPQRTTSARDEARPVRFGAWPYVVGGAGLATLGGAVAFELKRRGDQDRARDATTQLDFKQHSDRMQTDQLTARVLAGVGSALVVSGGVLLLLDQREPEKTRVGLGCGLDSCTAIAKGRF